MGLSVQRVLVADVFPLLFFGQARIELGRQIEEIAPGGGLLLLDAEDRPGARGMRCWSCLLDRPRLPGQRLLDFEVDILRRGRLLTLRRLRRRGRLGPVQTSETLLDRLAFPML